jgi:P pilus assembly chaperone PapD
MRPMRVEGRFDEPVACSPSRRARRASGAARLACMAAVACAASILATTGEAALSVVGTRFVYPGDARSLSILVRNGGKAPILVQAWLDDGDANADPSRLRLPFIVAPPLVRLDPAQPASIRVQSIDGGLAPDRESCFWINLLEVPPAAPAGENTLRIAYRLRMKVLFRPHGLRGDPDDAPGRLEWTHARQGDNGSIVMTNPTPYYVTLTRVQLHGKPVALAGGFVDVAPFGRADISIGTMAGTGPEEVEFDSVDDNGAQQSHRARLESR